MVKRVEKVLYAVEEGTRKLDLLRFEESIQDLTIASVSSRTGISLNNLSTELKILFKKGMLVRVAGRPVVYLSLPLLEEKIGRTIPVNEFQGLGELRKYLFPEKQIEHADRKAPLRGAAKETDRSGVDMLQADAPSLFDHLVGAEDSLVSSIETAKAAIIYPPNGLHVLITGPTGVGKSQFAYCMHDYAKQCGILKKDAPMVTFNCANYADNPQLLMSQLFGYVKGAYTGADKDMTGLVELADGGILFLDEIHRLSPEGQEKLFFLIDKGVFKRMGETGKERRVNLRLIGATTETLEDCMLNTFLRRVSVHILLPSLAERSVKERLTLVFYFLWREAQKIKQRIHLSRDIIDILVHYKCVANIGQLESDIRLTCAKVYFNYITGKEDMIHIKFYHISSGIQRGLFTKYEGKSRVVGEILVNPKENHFVVDGHQSFEETMGRYINQGVR